MPDKYIGSRSAPGNAFIKTDWFVPTSGEYETKSGVRKKVADRQLKNVGPPPTSKVKARSTKPIARNAGRRSYGTSRASTSI